jgi:hypothetical protein
MNPMLLCNHMDENKSYHIIHYSQCRLAFGKVDSQTQEPFTCLELRGGADKSLARPERKQATVTKLGIYSTHHRAQYT